MKRPPFWTAAFRVFDISVGQMLWSRRTVFMALAVGAPVVIALVLFIVVSRILKAAEGRVFKPKGDDVTTKECPFCCETVPLKATRCKFCTSQFA